jgi:hypothetical protein
MSDYINADDARLWEDGDAFRAAANTPLPTDIFASSLTGWDPLGGIKAGFTLTTDRDITDLDVWNNKTGAPYRRKKGPKKPTLKLRPVDNSKATTLLLLRGGSITTGGGGNEWLEGDDDEFGLIVRVYDGTAKKAYFIARGELNNIPEEVLNDDDIEGWDLEVGPLSPADGSKAIRKFTTYNALT